MLWAGSHCDGIIGKRDIKNKKLIKRHRGVRHKYTTLTVAPGIHPGQPVSPGSGHPEMERMNVSNRAK